MTELARQEAPSTELSIHANQDEFTQRQVAALAQIGMKDASPADLAVFFHHCKRTGLDPFARQIYMIGRWSKEGTKQTIQVGIDGLRLIAQREAARSGDSFGYEDTLWCGPDGQWTDAWLKSEPPAAAKVTVLRGGNRFSGTVHFNEVAQRVRDGGLTQMWRDKAALMVAKCAEAAALRKAFPQDLSGLYTDDEMGQADNPPAHATPAQVKDILAAGQSLGLSSGEVAAQITAIVGRQVNGWQDIHFTEVEQIKAGLTAATPTENEEN